jgi:hypothetical protein
MFIDGNSSKQQQRQNSAPLRPTDTNKLRSTSSLPDTNSNGSTSRRKSRKPIKIIQDSNENKSINLDEDTQSIGFIDEDDDITAVTHSVNNTSYNEQNSLPNDDDDESHSNTVDTDFTNNSNTTVSFILNLRFISFSKIFYQLKISCRIDYISTFLKDVMDVFFEYISDFDTNFDSCFIKHW